LRDRILSQESILLGGILLFNASLIFCKFYKIINSIDPDTTNSDGSKTIASLQSQLSDMQKEIEELKKKGE